MLKIMLAYQYCINAYCRKSGTWWRPVRYYSRIWQHTLKVARNEVENVSFAQRSAHRDSRIWRPDWTGRRAQATRAWTTTDVQIGLLRPTDFATVHYFVQLPPSDFRLQRHIFKQDCRKSKPILVGLRSCRWEVWDMTSRKGRERKKKKKNNNNQEKRTKKKTKKDWGWLIF